MINIFLKMFVLKIGNVNHGKRFSGILLQDQMPGNNNLDV